MVYLGVVGERSVGQIIGVLVGDSLPGAMRNVERHGDIGRPRELTVIGHFLVLITGQTEAKRLGNQVGFLREGLQVVL
jgi:hypothetical protein